MKQGFDAEKYLEQQSKYSLVENLLVIYMQKGFYLDLMKMPK